MVLSNMTPRFCTWSDGVIVPESVTMCLMALENVWRFFSGGGGGGGGYIELVMEFLKQ